MEVARRIDEICGSGTPSIFTFWLSRRCTRNPCRFLHPKTVWPGTVSRALLIAEPAFLLPSYECNPNWMITENGRHVSNDVNICRRSTSSICKYWANGHCIHDEHCWDLHSWFDGIETEFQEGNPKPVRLVWWTAPPENFVKINCDGAFSSHQNKAAAGGVVRNLEGGYITSFSSILTSCSSVLETELLAIKIGMEIAMSRGFRNLAVESDSLTAIKLINSRGQQQNHDHHPCAALVSSILKIGNEAEHVCWNHVFRETNSVADGLAKHGLSLSPRVGVKHFESPPPFILIPMCADDAGVTYTR